MKNILLIFRNSFSRNIMSAFLAAATAILMCVAFSNAMDSEKDANPAVGKICVGVVDSDNSELSGNLAKYLTDSLNMEISSENYDFLSQLLIDKKISAIIEVPNGFESSAIAGNPKKLEITMLDDYENSAFITVYINTYMRGISVISQGAGGDEELFAKMLGEQKYPNTVTLSETNSDVDRRLLASEAYYSVVGLMLSISSIITVLIAKQIVDDRQLCTYNRIRCTPVKPLQYVIGIGLFGLACLTVANLIFNIFAYNTCAELTIPFGIAFGTTELFMLFAAGLGIMIALMINNSFALMTAGLGYGVIGSMLGGVWFPINENLGFVSGIAKIFPQYWVMDLLHKYRSNPDMNVLPNISVLALATVLIFLISAVIFTRKKT